MCTDSVWKVEIRSVLWLCMLKRVSWLVSLWEVSLWACSLLYEPHLQDADEGPSPSVLCAPGEGDGRACGTLVMCREAACGM